METMVLSKSEIETAVGRVPRVETSLGWRDLLDAVKVRLDIGRMRSAVTPGLYAVGSPTPESPVLVGANYKLSFDHLRRSLKGLDAWIAVLDTKGINVWCAAGGELFGTAELLRSIEALRLHEVVSHRTLILPQLGAPGVSSHEVKKQSGFSVVYGPVRASDIPEFLERGMKATPEMRLVRFGLMDRLAIAPVELVATGKTVLLMAVVLAAMAGLGPGGYSVQRATTVGLCSGLFFLVLFLTGVLLFPTLLPWLPGRAFSAKGAWLGIALAAIAAACGWSRANEIGPWSAVGWLIFIPAFTSFLAMTFTGASTYTSLSGVKREMRTAVPIQVVLTVASVGFWLAGRFV